MFRGYLPVGASEVQIEELPFEGTAVVRLSSRGHIQALDIQGDRRSFWDAEVAFWERMFVDPHFHLSTAERESLGRDSEGICRSAVQAPANGVLLGPQLIAFHAFRVEDFSERPAISAETPLPPAP